MLKTITALLVCFSFAACIEESTDVDVAQRDDTTDTAAAVPTCEAEWRKTDFAGWVCAITRRCNTPGYIATSSEDENGDCQCECQRTGPVFEDATFVTYDEVPE